MDTTIMPMPMPNFVRLCIAALLERGSMAEMHSITRKSQPQIDFRARATRSKTCPAALASGSALACQRLAQAACGLSSRIYLHHKGFSPIEQNRARQIAGV